MSRVNAADHNEEEDATKWMSTEAKEMDQVQF